MVTIKHVEDSELLPYRNAESAGIALDSDGTLYSREFESNMIPVTYHYGIDLSWYLNAELTSDGINTLLDEIAPLAEQLFDEMDTYYDDSNNERGYLTDEGDELYSDIEQIINEYNNGEFYKLSKLNWYDWFVNGECPSFIRDYIENDEGISEGVYFFETPDEAYKESMSSLLGLFTIYTFDQANKSIKSAYRNYKNDGYESDFWNDYMQRILKNFDDYITVENKKIYYNDEEIILN